MKYKVEIVNNPYTQNVRILLNGKAASEYGGLAQYQDEPFWNWCGEIFEAVYKECNQAEFLLRYTGREEEDAVLEVLARDYNFCEYLYVPYEKQETFQQKMKYLNGWIVQKKLEGIKKREIHTTFYLSAKYERFKSLLLDMSIENHYCTVISEVKGIPEADAAMGQDDVAFVISDGIQAEEFQRMCRSRFVFGIEIGARNGFVHKSGRCFLYQATENGLFSVIFGCFKLAPLLSVFCECISQIYGRAKEDESLLPALADLQSIENPCSVELDATEIELGKSIPIRILKDGQRLTKEIDFAYSKPGILQCNGMYIEGMAEGSTSLYLFRKGEAIPFYAITLCVRKRNRIQKITTEDSKVVLGVGDEFLLKYEPYPPNADNLNEIKCKSSNHAVASISEKGKIRAVAQGDCQLYVVAEQVSAMVQCVVKPYMEHLKLLSEEQIEALLGDTFEIQLEYSPKNCIDDKITIESEDLKIVNVIGMQGKAVGYGETRIQIENKSSGLKQEIHVSVKKKIKKKKGFMRRFFH